MAVRTGRGAPPRTGGHPAPGLVSDEARLLTEIRDLPAGAEANPGPAATDRTGTDLEGAGGPVR
ncbi:hypothetical protein [Frankia sp. AgB32]|uniref:hypothetical protein n=1 Tax=Frankia sp. AgB32 TaxID=631119 RepID=UPI00200DEDAA|nr:hypothetical protein [Frankia sp. AgB32]MCK9896724.1 hypothetical protein [Frankia sp. AgB32]